MIFTALDIARTSIKNLVPYQPGKPISELTREFGITDVIKLASNENPFGPSQKVQDAIQQEITNLQYYPDGNGYLLKEKLAKQKKVSISQITLGNGSDDIFNFALRVFADKENEVIVSQYAFAAYAIATKAIGAKLITVPAKNWGHDLTAMANAVTKKTKVIFIANPNNPTGTWNTYNEVKDFLKKIPSDVIVVIDQAYFEFIKDLPEYKDAASLINEFPNLIVTYTFSKAYGLAGLRIGYSLSSDDIADLLNRVRLPFNVNTLGIIAATVALEDTEHLVKSLNINKTGMQQLQNGFNKMNLDYLNNPVTNFLTVDVKVNAAKIYQEMLKKGIIVRPLSNYGMHNHLRISIGLPEHNERCLNALEGILYAELN